MALDAQKALLDELMGRGRNLLPEDAKNAQLKWDEPDVCKFYLCGFCPHDLFPNTKADLGLCRKIHDDKLVEEYRKSTRFERVGYESEMCDFLLELISDVDKRIKRGHARLKLNSESDQATVIREREEKIAKAAETMTELAKRSEELGLAGKIAESKRLATEYEQLSQERAELEQEQEQYKASLGMVSTARFWLDFAIRC